MENMTEKVKILVVEDEPIAALDIKRTILKLGHMLTDIVSTYDDALKSVQENKPDMIFMDINLENSRSGIDIAQEINRRVNVNIIYLTAYSDEQTIQNAARTNPSGYLLKPFNREEIKSIIIITRQKSKFINNENYFSLGYDYFYDLEYDNLFFKDVPIFLSLHEKIFLKFLIEAEGAIVPVAQLEAYIWPDGIMSDSAFRTLVYRLRCKLKFNFIKTIPSFGYKLIK